MSLTVVYGTRRFKTPAAPNTLLSQVRDKVCEGLELDPNEFGLAKQGKPLDLTLSFRLSNLVNHSQLELVKTKKLEEIRVKIRIPNGQDFIGQFSNSTTAQDILNSVQLPGQLLLNNVSVLPETVLGSLGGKGGILFTYRGPPPGQASGKPAHSVPYTTQSSKQSVQPEPEVTTAPAAEPSAVESQRAAVVTAYQNIPTPQRLAEEAESNPEMTSNQFLTYYNHIKAQAEPPMVSKSTQSKLKAGQQKQKLSIEATTIRIKFPDQNTLEGRFANGEHGSDVYNFVKMYLRHPDHAFELVSMKPQFVLQPKAHLINDCELGSRALLVFKPGSRSSDKSFLNDRALAMATPPRPERDTNINSQNGVNKSSERSESAPADPEKPEKKSLKSKMTPKWLKLHK